MAGNTGTITFTVPLNAQLGTWFRLLQGTSNGQIQQIPISVVVTSQPKVKLQTVIGQISVSSVSGAGQAVDLTRLGSADWFSAGLQQIQTPLACITAPALLPRKRGGSGLIPAVNRGTGDGWFYPFTPNLINMTWSDGTAAPNQGASHINNTLVQIQSFAGTQTRVLTIVAGLIGGGTLVTNLHLTDGRHARRDYRSKLSRQRSTNLHGSV